MRLVDFFDRGATLFPNNTCFIEDDVLTSYADAAEMTHRIANGLLAQGITVGHHAAVYSPNSALAFQCVLGLLRTGAAWVPINARNAIDQNIEILQDSDCEALFYHSDFEQHIAQIRDQVSGIKVLICIDKPSELADYFAEWIKPHQSPAPYVPVDKEEIAFLASTGGTTGRSKQVMLTNLNMATMVASFNAHMPYLNELPVYLCAAPMTHAAGATCFPLMAAGGTILVMAKADPKEILANIPKHQVTTLFLPPTVIYMMLADETVRSHDYSSLQNFIYGAAPMSVDKLKESLEVFGPVMTQLFGQAESPMTITFMTPEEHVAFATDPELNYRLASCGRRTMYTEVAIMDDDGKLLATGERGEIVVRGNLVMKGYYKNPEASAEASAHGWHHTGDIGEMDSDGYLFIVDRKKDMIISGGFNVFPSEVEQVIWSHDAVQDCAVIGVPDDKWGESVKAVVELKPGATITEDELIALCKAQLGSVKAPKTVDIVKELPRSAVGKVLKKTLRADYWQGSSRQI